MDGFEVMKTIHVLAAVIWVGGGVTTQVYATRIRNQQDPARLAAFAKDIEWVGQRVYTPASLIVLLLGIGMVLESTGSPDFSDLWIILALVGIGLSIIIGVGYLGPTSGRLGTLIEERGPEDAEAQQMIGRILVVSRVDLAILLLIVVDMVVQPS